MSIKPFVLLLCLLPKQSENKKFCVKVVQSLHISREILKSILDINIVFVDRKLSVLIPCEKVSCIFIKSMLQKISNIGIFFSLDFWTLPVIRLLNCLKTLKISTCQLPWRHHDRYLTYDDSSFLIFDSNFIKI